MTFQKALGPLDESSVTYHALQTTDTNKQIVPKISRGMERLSTFDSVTNLEVLPDLENRVMSDMDLFSIINGFYVEK